jgi:FkbM family methyltransferase
MHAVKPLRDFLFRVLCGRKGYPIRIGARKILVDPCFRRYGGLDDPLAEAMDRYLQPGSTFVDVGANIGLYSAYAAACVGKSGHVYAFEPDASNFQMLRRNMDYCSNAASIFLVESAVSDDVSVSELTFYVLTTSAGIHPQSSLRPSLEGMREVKVKNTTLDQFFGDKPRFDFVKIDTEGAEMQVLKGGAEVIKRDRPVLCIEYHGGKCKDFGYSVEELEEYVKGLGYTEQRIWQGSGIGHCQTIALPDEGPR